MAVSWLDNIAPSKLWGVFKCLGVVNVNNTIETHHNLNFKLAIR